MSMWALRTNSIKQSIPIPSIQLFNKMPFQTQKKNEKNNLGKPNGIKCPIAIKEKINIKEEMESGKKSHSIDPKKPNKHKNNSIDSTHTCFPQIYDNKSLNIKPHTSSEYKRPQAKLRKGQNELMFEKIQEKYTLKLKGNNQNKNPNNDIETGTDFFKKTKRLNKSMIREGSNCHLKDNKREENNNKQNVEAKLLTSNTFFNQCNIVLPTKGTDSVIDKYDFFMRNKNHITLQEKISKTMHDNQNNTHRSTEFLFKKLEKHLERNKSVDGKLNDILKDNTNGNDTNNPSVSYTKHVKSFSMTNAKIAYQNANNHSQHDESKKADNIPKSDFKITNERFYDSQFLQSKRENEITFHSFKKLAHPKKTHKHIRTVDSSIEMNPIKEDNEKHNFNHSVGGDDFNQKEAKDSTKYNIKEINMNNVINRVLENNKKLGTAKSKDYFIEMEKGFRNTHMRKTTNANFFSQQHFSKNPPNEPTEMPKTLNSLEIKLLTPHEWKKHEEVWSNITILNTPNYSSDIEKHLLPPNDNDVLISSYLKLFPMLINFCLYGSLSTLNKNNVNCLAFNIDDTIQNPKQEMKKWKDAYKKVLLRWHPDKLSGMLNNVKLRDESKKSVLLKKSTMVVNNMNSLFKQIMEILKKIQLGKNNQEA